MRAEQCAMRRWKPSVTYSPYEVADGTILTFALLLLQYQPNAPDIIGIEELERGLHPYLLGQIVDVLRAMTTGELGRSPVQIVLATHSAELLEFLEPEEVRFFTRDSKTGLVRVDPAPVDTPEWRNAYEVYQKRPGDLC